MFIDWLSINVPAKVVPGFIEGLDQWTRSHGFSVYQTHVFMDTKSRNNPGAMAATEAHARAKKKRLSITHADPKMPLGENWRVLHLIRSSVKPGEAVVMVTADATFTHTLARLALRMNPVLVVSSRQASLTFWDNCLWTHKKNYEDIRDIH